MSGTITTGNLPRLLQEGLNKVFGNAYEEHSAEWDKVFDTHKSSKNYEVDAQLEGMGLAPQKPEGDEISFDITSSIANDGIPRFLQGGDCCLETFVCQGLTPISKRR